MINIYQILKIQKRVENPEFTKIVLIHAVTTYLLDKNTTNFVEILKPCGALLNTFHVQVSSNSLKPLKRKYSAKDILNQLAEIIINHSGYENNLLVFLKTLITYENGN